MVGTCLSFRKLLKPQLISPSTPPNIRYLRIMLLVSVSAEGDSFSFLRRLKFGKGDRKKRLSLLFKVLSSPFSDLDCLYFKGEIKWPMGP